MNLFILLGIPAFLFYFALANYGSVKKLKGSGRVAEIQDKMIRYRVFTLLGFVTLLGTILFLLSNIKSIGIV